MKLKDWLSQNRMTKAEFARMSGIQHKQLVGRYVNGTSVPGARNMGLICHATHGYVTANDFFECSAPPAQHSVPYFAHPHPKEKEIRA